MTIDLYYVAPSPPCRSVLLLGQEIGLHFNPIVVNLLEKEQLKPEFLAVNPQHTVPTIVDHETGLTLWESRAILSYLVDQYSPDHKLYPKDPVARATIDRWLYFDMGSLQPNSRPIVRSIVYNRADPPAEAVNALREQLKVMDDLLVRQGTRFVAGDDLTIADLALVATLDMPVYLLPLDISQYTNVNTWYERVKGKAKGYEEVCATVLTDFSKVMKERKA